MITEERFGIAELAELGGVSRRTVRYYVQEGLLPAPLGVGRGHHYAREHLERLLEVKALQEQGRSLAEIREVLADGAPEPVWPPTAMASPPRSAWTRIELLPGLELSVSSAYRLPSPARLSALVELCGRLFRPKEDSDD